MQRIRWEKSEKNASKVRGAEEAEGGSSAVHQGRCPRQNTGRVPTTRYRLHDGPSSPSRVGIR